MAVDGKLKELMDAKWQTDEYGCYVIEHYRIRIWINVRQPYCDRGHWQGNVDGRSLCIDLADFFPRFYMDLEIAKKEMKAWLAWRLYKHSDTQIQIGQHAARLEGTYAKK